MNKYFGKSIIRCNFISSHHYSRVSMRPDFFLFPVIPVLIRDQFFFFLVTPVPNQIQSKMVSPEGSPFFSSPIILNSFFPPTDLRSPRLVQGKISNNMRRGFEKNYTNNIDPPQFSFFFMSSHKNVKQGIDLIGVKMKINRPPGGGTRTEKSGTFSSTQSTLTTELHPRGDTPSWGKRGVNKKETRLH